MKCPHCAEDATRVVDSRLSREGAAVRRRRQCERCGRRFTTYEEVASPVAVVVKRDGRREAFDPEKLRTSIRRALGKRPPADLVESVATTVEASLADGGEIDSGRLSELVCGALQARAPAAGLRYRSVSDGFESVEDFRRAADADRDRAADADRDGDGDGDGDVRDAEGGG